jgi:hypothetical protein
MAKPKRTETLELIAASSGVPPAMYSFCTHYPLAHILQADYWNQFSESGLKRNDVVRCVCKCFDDEPEVIWLRVASGGDTIVMVKEFAA